MGRHEVNWKVERVWQLMLKLHTGRAERDQLQMVMEVTADDWETLLE